MNISEFVEQREAVKKPLVVFKLLHVTSCIFAVKSRVLVHMIVGIQALACTRLFGEH